MLPRREGGTTTRRNTSPPEQMKHETKTNDLAALVALSQAEDNERAAGNRLAALSRERYPDPDKASRAALAVHEAATATDSTRADHMKRPPARRNLAAATLATAQECARRALMDGGSYSGSTATHTAWGDTPSARTTTGDGDQYSRSCTYHKTDATHTVTLDPAGCPLLHQHRDGLVAASARDGLPLIALYPLPTKEARAYPGTYRAVWVVTKGKRIEHVNGWVSGSASVFFHATTSPEAARKGYETKHARHLAELAERRRTRKDHRRASLVARLCHGVTATLADARAMHYCEPGIRAFQERHGVGDTATLPELIATGDPSAVRLALVIARKVRRDTREHTAA